MDQKAVEFFQEQDNSSHVELLHEIEAIATDNQRAAEDEANQFIRRSAEDPEFLFLTDLRQ